MIWWNRLWRGDAGHCKTVMHKTARFATNSKVTAVGKGLTSSMKLLTLFSHWNGMKRLGAHPTWRIGLPKQFYSWMNDSLNGILQRRIESHLFPEYCIYWRKRTLASNFRSWGAPKGQRSQNVKIQPWQIVRTPFPDVVFSRDIHWSDRLR